MVRDASTRNQHSLIAAGAHDGCHDDIIRCSLSDGRGIAIRADDVESVGVRGAPKVGSRVSGDLVDVGASIANGGFVSGTAPASVGEAGAALSERLQLHIPFLEVRPLAEHHVSGGDVRLGSLDISRGRHHGHEEGQAEEAGEASDGADELLNRG